MTIRYELSANPSFYEALRDGKVPFYHYDSIESISPGSVGANPQNVGNILKGVKEGDSLIFKVDKENRERLGHKGVEYEGELEKVVSRIERRGNTVYLYFKKD